MFKSKKYFPQVEHLDKSNTVYLDSAATSLKYNSVIQTQHEFDSFLTANVHRGSYKLSSEATIKYEDARTRMAEYLNCDSDQIVFTRGTTDAVNITAKSFLKRLTPKDAILISEMEHHSNMIPWQEVAKATGAELIFCSVDKNGELDLAEIKQLFQSKNIKIVSICHMSNTLGTINPVEQIQQLCRENGASFFVDGAQAVSAMRPSMKKLDPDFYAFSAHKVFGPFGIGVLFVKEINKLNMDQVGGGIVDVVDFHETSFLNGPQKMEAGTPNISAAISLIPLVDFLTNLDFEKIQKHEKELLGFCQKELSKIDGFQEIGTSKTKINILSFNFEGVHPNDLCELLDEQGVALRSGHHCTQPLLKKMGISGCARASFSIYNTKEDAQKFVASVKKSLEILR